MFLEGIAWFGQKAQQCKGGKQSKLRVTIAFIVNAAGEKEKPIFVWKSENPRCFKHVKKDQLPVDYFSQNNAWMTGTILHDVLGKIDRRLKRTNRSILLLMDNTGCHPGDIKGKFSNIKVVFLPPNTTSKLQPLDLGIIQNFKVYYRKLLLTFILAKIEECTNASEIVKSVTVLHALRWVAEAWERVTSETIQKCFMKAGILDRSGEVVTSPISDGEDPFADLDIAGAGHADIELLISEVQGSTDACSAICGDHGLSRVRWKLGTGVSGWFVDSK